MNSNNSEVLKFALECLLTLIDETEYKVSSLFYVAALRAKLLILARLENGFGEGMLAQRLLGHMCSCSNSSFVRKLIEEGILDSLEASLKFSPIVLEPLREICWILRNIVINSE